MRSLSLPLWGRWQPGGLTDEVLTGESFLGARFCCTHLTRPRLCSATLPRGEGLLYSLLHGLVYPLTDTAQVSLHIRI